MELINFMFQSFWHFIGSLIVINAFGNFSIHVLRVIFKPLVLKIKKEPKQEARKTFNEKLTDLMNKAEEQKNENI